ncbi:hypothetical protein KKC91_05110, partial [bacterium]|nr:hypothetical protein [bacterium]
MNEAKIKKISSMCTFICLFTISFFLASCGGGAPAEPAEPAETAIPSPTITPTPTQTATPTPTITPTEELGRYCIGEGGLWDGDEESPGDEELCKDGYLYYCLDSCDANSCTGRCKIDICNIDGAEVEIVEKFSTITVSTKFLCHGIDGWERLKGVPIESAEEPTETPTQEPTSEEPSDYQFSSPKGRVFFNEEGAQYNSDINSNKGILVITAENAGLKIT